MLSEGVRLYKYRPRGVEIIKLISSEKVAYLQVPAEQHRDWDFDLLLIREIEDYEQHLTGEYVGAEIAILPSQHTPPLDIRFAVAFVNSGRFNKLPDFQKDVVNRAWCALKRGRTLRRIDLEDDRKAFVLCSRPDSPQLAEMERKVSEIFEIFGLGYVSSDAYEILWARKMLNFEDTKGKQS